MASAQTPPQAKPPSLDELVDSAFSDEETVEKQMAVPPDEDLGAGFVGFVEAEPASTGEILAAMAEEAPISSAPALSHPTGSPGRAGNALHAATGEISGSATTPIPVEQHLPSVMFEDSPFAEGEAAATVNPSEIAPQLAALAAVIDPRQQTSPAGADTVLSSSPPPTDDSLHVEVVPAAGGSLPNVRTPAFVALSHADSNGAAVEDTAEPESHVADSSVESSEEDVAEPPSRPSGNTPVMALDDNEFHVLEDAEDHEHHATEVASEEVGAEAGAEADVSVEEHAVETSVSEDAPAAADDGSDANIDAVWSAVAESGPPGGMTSEDLPALDGEGEPVTEAAAEAEAETPDVGAADIPLSARVTPVLGLPVIDARIAADIKAAAEEAAAAAAAANAQAEVSAELPLEEVSSASQSGEINPHTAITVPAVALDSSKISPPRDNTPPVPPAALRKTSPGAAQPPPPPPPTAKAPPPPPKAATQAPPPPVPAPAAAPPPPVAARPAAAPAAAVNAPPAAPPGGLNFGEETKLRKKRRSKQWFEEIFDEDYLHTLPFMTPHQTEREVAFLLETLELPSAGRVLDIGCGYGRHAMEMAARGYRTVGLDLSLPLLIRATDAARRVGVNVDFVHGDMRDMTFENEFDGAYCFFTTFGYFDDDTNRRVATGICRALKPGGRFVLEMLNRDYLINDLPTRVWWQGDGCVVLEEVDFNYFTSRLQVQRQIILENGRQLEQEISIRAYSLHEIGKVLHHAGFRVLEVSGNLNLRGRFYGNESRQLVVVAERRADSQG